MLYVEPFVRDGEQNAIDWNCLVGLKVKMLLPVLVSIWINVWAEYAVLKFTNIEY